MLKCLWYLLTLALSVCILKNHFFSWRKRDRESEGAGEVGRGRTSTQGYPRKRESSSSLWLQVSKIQINLNISMMSHVMTQEVLYRGATSTFERIGSSLTLSLQVWFLRFLISCRLEADLYQMVSVSRESGQEAELHQNVACLTFNLECFFSTRN